MNSKSFEQVDLDLLVLARLVWRGKLIVILTTFLSGLVAILVALSLPDVYRASALLEPSEEVQGGGLSALAGQLGGIASLAGIGIGSQPSNKVLTSIEIIRSRKFAEYFLQKYDLLPPLIAADKWDRKSGKLLFDNEVYDDRTKTWVRDVEYPKSQVPTMWEAYEEYRKVLTVSLDSDTGLVRLSIEHVSPLVAQEWVCKLVKEVNYIQRQQDISEAETNIDYLEAQLSQTSVSEMREVFYQIIEEQVKKVMLAKAREEYVFKTIDPAVVPEEKESPHRAIIVFVGLFFGSIIGLMVIFATHINVNANQKS